MSKGRIKANLGSKTPFLKELWKGISPERQVI